mmetsp:Transcript_48471/g.117280  ORF Transcript_48471/g.117280 Transcript_48471/m.117280 type:complete len:127 (-) Transcript_48471:1104-1484(-)
MIQCHGHHNKATNQNNHNDKNNTNNVRKPTTKKATTPTLIKLPPHKKKSPVANSLDHYSSISISITINSIEKRNGKKTNNESLFTLRGPRRQVISQISQNHITEIMEDRTIFEFVETIRRILQQQS